MTTEAKWILTGPEGQTWVGKSKTEVFDMTKQSQESRDKQQKAKGDARARLAQLLEGMKIPQTVRQGDYYAAVAFKEAVDAAQSVLNRKNATAQALQEAVTSMERYAS